MSTTKGMVLVVRWVDLMEAASLVVARVVAATMVAAEEADLGEAASAEESVVVAREVAREAVAMVGVRAAVVMVRQYPPRARLVNP